jgi:hypothetical protein
MSSTRGSPWRSMFRECAALERSGSAVALQRPRVGRQPSRTLSARRRLANSPELEEHAKAPQVFDLPLHRRDLFLLFPDPEGQGRFGLLFRLVADGGEFGLDLFLDGQVHLALGVVELALLSDQVGLGLLRFGQLGVALTQHVVEFGNLLDLVIKVDGDQALRLLRLGRSDAAALLIDLGGHLGVDGISRRGDLR